MSDDEIIRAINLYTASWIVITGGEPCMHIDDDFVRMLKRTTGKQVAVETNGTFEVPSSVDWVTVSPKIGLVDLGQNLEPYFDLSCRGAQTLMYLQPCYVPEPEQFRANRMRTVRRVLADPRWTLSVQLHRFLGIP